MNIVPIKPAYLSPEELYYSLQTMAILEIIMLPPEAAWLRLVKKHPSRKAYFIDDVSGNIVDIWFEAIGVFIKGFDHENEWNQFAADKWDETFFQKTYQDIPKQFFENYKDDKEKLYEMTFCMWYDAKENCWKQNANLEKNTDYEERDGGKDFLLSYIYTSAEEWIDWANYYYKKNFDLKVVKKIYDGQTITTQDIAALNPERDTKEAFKEILALKNS